MHTHNILLYHRDAADMWGLGGKAYDRISFGISDALAHAAQRLSAKAGEHVLDVATGTGWTARNIATLGANVTAVDISPSLLAAAEELSAHVRPPIDFQQADAEQLPFEDARFDKVISTFGVMFAVNHRRAASELIRVCRPGGRLVLANWMPGGAIERFFRLIAEFSAAPAPTASPLQWGNPDYVRDLLGEDFDLILESGENHAFYDDAEHLWGYFSEGFGPIRQVIERLNQQQLERFHQAIKDYHNEFLTEANLLHIRREYLVVTGYRK